MSDPESALASACRQLGIDPNQRQLIRAGENTLYLLPGKVVARVTREGQIEVARKETRVSRWLHEAGVPVINVVSDIAQPKEVDGRAITFWRELPEHTEGSIEQVADILSQIHRLRPPAELHLPPLAPFVRLKQRIDEATAFETDDRAWLMAHLEQLQEAYRSIPTGLPFSAVHGDAWGGNIVSTAAGPVVLDLERFAYGPPEWDLASIAVDHFTFGSLSEQQWATFCERYGYDVTTWPGYTVLRDARELRKVTFAAQMATQHPGLNEQAQYRLSCIRGEHGSRPWHWTPVP